MYSIKEKMKLLRELHNPEYAETDLRLLREVSPQNDLFRSPIVNASRSAEKILYTLLDHTTVDKIRLNRRGMEVENKLENELNNENSGEKETDNSDSKQATSTEQPDGNPTEGSRKDNSDGDTGQGDVAGQLQDKTNELEETLEELESTQAELEETQNELEEIQSELEMTKEELDTQKKSELDPIPDQGSSKKKTSTHKSTGKISSTKTSKSRR